MNVGMLHSFHYDTNFIIAFFLLITQTIIYIIFWTYYFIMVLYNIIILKILFTVKNNQVLVKWYFPILMAGFSDPGAKNEMDAEPQHCCEELFNPSTLQSYRTLGKH